ncbi:hypothetical protein EVAR_23376_1 [Eumeta japonica]|uniref:Histone-lysine N-methyltransferase SETMAR n=1 Tax=Eumeta variegata TaxID=151549 RepID=A0A4C1VUD3_EUMVA|nr:hypothetical protein EVAR_23376_1 [Eumeta japonica]
MRLKQGVEKKGPELINRKGVVFLHDSARPHVSLATHIQTVEPSAVTVRAAEQAAVQTHTHTRASALRRLNETAGAGINFRRAVEREGDFTSSPTPHRRSTSLRLTNFQSGHFGLDGRGEHTCATPGSAVDDAAF